MRSAAHDVFGDPAEVLHLAESPVPVEPQQIHRLQTLDCAVHHGFMAVVGESGAGKSTLGGMLATLAGPAIADGRVAAAYAQIGVADAAFFPSIGLSATMGLRNATLAKCGAETAL